MMVRTGYLTNVPVFFVKCAKKINMKRKNRRIMKGNTRNRTRKKLGAIEAELNEEDEEMIGLIKVKRF
jgi:hypothetical protein